MPQKKKRKKEKRRQRKTRMTGWVLKLNIHPF